MRRLLYCLLGSTLFHGALLWVPFPMSAGGAGEDALQPIRVELMYASRTETPKRVARRPVQAEGPKAPPRANVTETRPKAPARAAIRIATAVPEAPKRVDPTPARTRPAAKMPPRRPRPEPTRAPGPTAAAKPRDSAWAAGPAAPGRNPAGEAGENEDAATREPPNRGLAKRTSPDRGFDRAAGFSPARYARTVPPRYPGKARRAGWEGTTVLKVLVDPEGAPDRVAVDRTSGFEILDAAAVKAVRRWRFHPARRGIDAVPSWVRIPVAFKLKEDLR